MSEEGEGGHATEGGGEEAPAWNNLWGHKEQADNAMYLHDAPDAWNGVNQAEGLTQRANAANGFRDAGVDAATRAAQAEHLAQNAELMGNDEMAAKFAARSSSLESTAKGFEAAGEDRGLLNAAMENPLVKGGAGVAGMALGGLSAYNGFEEFQHGNKTQGAADMVAGGLNVGAGGLATASALGLIGEGGALAAAGTVAAPIAVAAGLAAAGNSYTKDHNMFGFLGINPKGGGTWGVGADGKPRDSIQFVGDTTASAYNSVNKWAGGGVKGAIAGGLAGAGTAIGTGALALGTDIVGGGISVAKGIGSLASSAGGAIAGGARAVGSGLVSGAKAIGSGIGSAAKSVGNFISHLW
ncbi:MAG: hypothetical protein ACM31C_08945 [Acidobacteriota bacterium]